MSSDLSYRGQLDEGTEGPRGRGQRGGSSLEGAGKVRKGSRKGVDRGAQRALIPSFSPVNVLVNLIAVNQMDPYDSGRSGGVPSSLRSPQPPNPSSLSQRS
jgi:hypothetical protein